MTDGKININGFIEKCLQCGLMSVYEADKADGHRCSSCGGYTIPHGECYIGIDMGREEDEVVYYSNGKECFREVSPRGSKT